VGLSLTVKYPPYPIKLISIYACRSIASTDIPDLFLLTNTIYLTQTLHTSTWPTHYQLCRSSSLLFSVRTPVFKVPDLVWSSTHILYSSTIRSLPPGRLRTRSRHQHLPDNSWVLALFSRIRLYRNILLTISTHRYFPGAWNLQRRDPERTFCSLRRRRCRMAEIGHLK
jgi:hypothetical protein